MPSFDIVNKLDLQLLDNAINTAKKELITRYDLKDSECEIDLDKKSKMIKLQATQDMALQSMVDIILGKMSKQQLDVRSLDLSKESRPSGKLMLLDIPVKEGLDKEVAKKVVNYIKTTGLKVQASIMDDQVRVTGKKIDDLQETIGKLRTQDFELPLQFDNMRS
ncbi:MAG: YajQ family cyclic di-GMP-binding protein [Bacteroidetes bacterium]|nr:YajQ family cyclic di-GMP-binding protein [Bacteroidota bacterium]